MRLWHQNLISKLPRQQLLGQHRECCALRGNGWGKTHSTVNYVFKYSPFLLYQFHMLVMEEMLKRGYRITREWYNKNYRGKFCQPYQDLKEVKIKMPIYKEHNEEYYKECLNNLKSKNVLLFK